WAETAAARFRDRIAGSLPAASSTPPDPMLFGKLAAKARRIALPRNLPEPGIWLFSLSRNPGEPPKACPGTGLETQFSRLIGSLIHEIDRRNRFEPGRPRPSAWRQTLDRMFGFGVSTELFEFSSRGRAFPVIFQGKYYLCVWDFIQKGDDLTAAFLMLLPSGMHDAETARRLCFTNWRFISRGQPLEPVFIPFPIAPAIPGKIRVRHDSALLKTPDIRRFIRQKASELSLRCPAAPNASSAREIARWYHSRQVYGMTGEIRLPDQDIHRVFPAGPGQLACWSSLDVTAGGLGLLIGPEPDATSVFASFAGKPLVFAWVFLWVVLLIRTALSGSPPSFGIRAQLAFWVLCLASLPLIIAISETGKLLGDLRGNMLREYDQELSQALREMENEDSILTQRFGEICHQQTKGASRAVDLQKLQLGKQPLDPVMNVLWNDLTRLGIPIHNMILFGHGGLEWSRHGRATSPELGSSLVNFLRPMSFKLLREYSPKIDARFEGSRPKSLNIALDKLVPLNLRDLKRKDRQIAETIADNKRMLKFHQFLKVDGEAWYLLVLFWEQSAAYTRHIRTCISAIAAKYQVDLEVTRHTFFGEISIARSGKPLRQHEPGTHSTPEDRIISVQSTQLPGFLLTASRPLAPLNQRLFEETGKVLAGVLGNLLLIVLSGGILAAWLTTPLRRMAAALREVAAGRLDRKLGMNRHDELGQAADTLDSMTEWLRERHAMSLFVAPQVLEAVTVAGASSRKPERRRIIALTSDIRSFITISETRPPEEVFSALNRHFRAMTPPIKEQGGVIDRFIGDAIQAVFYETPSVELPAVRALRAARAMMTEHRKLQRDRAGAGLFTYEIGIGLASGEAVCGILCAD
ncbi:MAG TPA: HAMP domain-containing protein, partial [Candidatus Ozemobacteraceae bacterium]|nr:HAMP domain-containing protein [Candidatus Ozemobacteraceae bacterium]